MRKNYLLATVGHTIVVQSDGTWIPSRMYQEVVWLKPGGPIERTHIDKRLDPDGENSYLGGAEIVCRAMARLAKIYPDADTAFIGGRPPSMKKRFPQVTHLHESSVMAEFFKKMLGEERNILFPFDVTDSCNTGTDMRDLAAIGREYDQTIVVCMGFRLPRCRALFEDYLRNNPHHAETGLRVTFADAEQFLSELFDEFVVMNQSHAYASTMSQERFGVQGLLQKR